VDFAIWMPIFVMVASAAADVSIQLAYRANLDRATLDTAHAIARGRISAADAESYLKERVLIGDPDAILVTATKGSEASVTVTRNDDPIFTFSIAQYLITLLPEGYLAEARMLVEPG
jgi:hypothetical protein